MSRDKSINLSNPQKIPPYNNLISAEIPLRTHPANTGNPPLQKGEIKHLKQSILSTLVYYDCLDYPLTLVEIFRYLVNPSNCQPSSRCHPEGGARRIPRNIQRDSSSACWQTQNDSKKEAILTPPSKKACPELISRRTGGISATKLSDIINVLEANETLKKIIAQKNGFYFLTGRESIVETRIWRKKMADEKWKKLKPTLLLCQTIPYVRAIFISGSLALGNTKKESDIDILVIAAHKHIWTCRAFLTVFLSILGKYRQTNSTENKICANHYITDQSLAVPFPSLYNAQTYAHFFAADSASNNYMGEFKKSNGWINDYLNYFDPNENTNMHNETVRKSWRLSLYVIIRKLLEAILTPTIGNYLENKFRAFESARIKKSGLYNKSGGRITISDEQLEFHPDSPEKIIVEKFNAKMRDLNFPELTNLKDSGLTK